MSNSLGRRPARDLSPARGSLGFPALQTRPVRSRTPTIAHALLLLTPWLISSKYFCRSAVSFTDPWPVLSLRISNIKHS
ncbi:hypothetical protein V3C33_20260 [Micrococcaceae bacterium Sec5.7]